MTLSEFVNKNGRIAGLKAIGEKKMASDLDKAEKYKQSVVDNEGVIPFAERPKSTQLKLNSANEICFKADNLIWEKQKQIVK